MSKYPQIRKFEVIKTFRRYDSVVYMCGGVYTVLEELVGIGKKFSVGEFLEVELRIKEIGYYRQVSSPGTHFAFHELDVMLKEKILKEF